MTKQILVLSIMTVAFIGCTKGSGSPAPSAAGAGTKSVWSTWTSSNGQFIMNLSSGQFGSQLVFSLLVSSGAVCSCQFLANGTNASGTYSMSSCTYTSGGTGDPGCASLNQTGTFVNDGTTMTACATGSTCTSYH